MERSISSLAFKGSIAEAIVEAKRQKKLFVVYISGDDAESVRLENSTWVDINVAESLLKYCILLHILEGSADAAQFSVIYPQKSVPCITAIGYNGVQLWQNEGFISAEILASSLEKAWLSLHIQETTATFLAAALASKKSEPHASGVSNTVLFEQGSSSSTDVPSPLTSMHVQSPEAGPLADSEIIKENKACEHSLEEVIPKLGEASSSSVNELESGGVEQSITLTETAKESLSPVKRDQNNAGVGHVTFSVKDEFTGPEENLNVITHHSEVATEVSREIANDLVQEEKAETVEDGKAVVLDSYTNKSTDVHLNIRLPDGASLQEKFSVMSTLRTVKDYVEENQASGIGTYDLAIPYPRRVFNDQDLGKSLSELGLFNRQALIVIPHRGAIGHHRGGSSSHNQTISNTDVDSSSRSNEGYLAFLKRVISYMNPLSYLGGGAGSSNSATESQSSMWQYGPNPTLQNNLRGMGRPVSTSSSNQGTASTSGNNSKSRKQTSSRFGGNIHTLKHDEDDSKFSDKNAFWNGNSTQYGGNNDDK